MFVRFVGLFRRRRHEAEMNDELRAHLDALIERNRVACMSPEEARFAASVGAMTREQIFLAGTDSRFPFLESPGQQVLRVSN
jgi:hypothetical protein